MVSVEARVQPWVTNTITNTALVTQTAPNTYNVDDNPGNNEDTETTDVSLQADLHIWKWATATTSAGEQITYTCGSTTTVPPMRPLWS